MLWRCAVTYYATCADADYNPQTGQCTNVVYVQQPTLLAPLSIDDGVSIGLAILLCWAIAWGWTAMGRVLNT